MEYIVLYKNGNFTEFCDNSYGIYCWYNTINNKKYIGLAGGNKGLRGRLADEVTAIKKDKSCGAPLLYQAVKKHGVDNFVIYLLFKTDDPKLLGDVEKGFISLYESQSPNGYNITEGGKGTIGFSNKVSADKKRGTTNHINSEKRAKKYKVLNPQGDVYTITNLTAFCRAYDLSYSAMLHLVNGRSCEHKGWKNLHKTKEDFYKKLASEAYFVSPSNELYRVFNIKKFSIYLGGQQAYFNKVWKDKEKVRKAMGWRRATDEEIQNFDETIHKTWFHDKLI
jgi:L-rhamnose mutarotase